METRDWEQQIINSFKPNSDLTIKTVIVSGWNLKLIYLKTLVDITQMLATLSQLAAGRTEDNDSLLQMLLPLDPRTVLSPEEIMHALLQGKMIVWCETFEKPIVINTEQYLVIRNIAPPESENPIQASFDAFTEELDKNIGLLRKKMNRSDLSVETCRLGTNSQKGIALVYIEGMANAKMIRQIEERLNRNMHRDVHSVADLTGVLEQPKWSLVPTYLSTEQTENAVLCLLDGKAVIFMDQHPFAIIFPAVVKDLWSFKADANYPALYQFFFCGIRIAGLLFAIVLPGLYVVLNAVNPELLRIQLAISVSKSREGVPYPSLIEVLLMLILLEMVIEATIRLPKSIGPTITMIGGIILGQAIVQAKLVSNLLIIILAASTIANYTMAGYLNTVGIRLYRYAALIVSNLFGIFGLEASIIWLCIYLANLQTFSVPYLSLSAKGNAKDE